MRKLFGAIMGAAVLGFAAPAFAGACTVGPCSVSGGPLTLTDPVAIEGWNVPLGEVDHQGWFAVDSEVIAINSFAGTVYDEPIDGVVPSGFANLAIEFFQDGMSLGSYALTNADGTTALSHFMVSLISASDVSFAISGQAFRNLGASLPDYNIDLLGVPVPGALPLLIAGLAGLSFAMRRRKKTA